MGVEVAEHLGGYVSGEHGDEATYYPDLWRWLVEGPLQVKSVLDIGCGEGHSMGFFRDLGCQVRGIEGTPQDDPDIIEWDFTKGAIRDFSFPPGKTDWTQEEIDDFRFDLVWCCEFVEHVEEQYAKNFIPALQSGRIVLMTHAFPGQAGHHHVNCQPPEYWRGFMAAAGLTYSKGLSEKTREIAAKNEYEWNHFIRSGMAFRG